MEEWTSRQPPEPGYYWHRDPYGNEPEILKVSEDGVVVFGEAGIGELSDFADGEWLGPLLPPV